MSLSTHRRSEEKWMSSGTFIAGACCSCCHCWTCCCCCCGWCASSSVHIDDDEL